MLPDRGVAMPRFDNLMTAAGSLLVAAVVLAILVKNGFEISSHDVLDYIIRHSKS
jgi:hypothetical protein